MKKILAFLATALAVLGVFWFQTRTSKGGREPLVATVNDSPSSALVDPSKEINRPSFIENAHPESSSELSGVSEPSRRELLEEYWRLLLGDARKDWCPSKRVDSFKELGNLLSLDLEEAKEHLDALTNLDDIYLGDRAMFAGVLINQIATRNPVEAVAYMVGSSHPFGQEDYESVVRMWMDAEGVSVMDWFDQSGVEEVKVPLARAFFSVYAEEDPYDYLLRYGSIENSFYNQEATALLYQENGAAVYENLKAAGLEPGVLADSFTSIGRDLFEEDPNAARDWISANRHTVDQEATKQLTIELLHHGYHYDAQLVGETLEWALKQQVFSADDPTVKNLVRNMGRRNAEPVRAVLQRIQTQSGLQTGKLIEVLPKPVEVDEEVFFLEPFETWDANEAVFYCGLSMETFPEPDPEKVAQLIAGLLN